MTSLLDYCPRPEGPLPWDDMDREYPWLRALRGCPQDPIYHAEGDVWIHTRMVLDALIRIPAWCELSTEERRIVFAAAVLHDVGKPDCTRTEETGRISSRGHSRRGAIMGRNILWQMGVPFAQREVILSLVRYHQVPYYLIDRPDAERLAIEISVASRGDLLAILAEADVRGRICDDQQRLLDNVALFREQLIDLDCLGRAYPFASDHSRLLYLRGERASPDDHAHEDFRASVILMSGLPGSGKDHFIRTDPVCRGLPVISLDQLRDEMDIAPDDDQGEIVNRARELARQHLRRGENFIWNATNISRQLRALSLGLFLGYAAHVCVVYVEVPCSTLFAQNRGRERRVPEQVMHRLLDRWEVPDLTEAHEVMTCVKQ